MFKHSEHPLGSNMLLVGENQGEWKFQLETHIRSIHGLYPDRDLYIVGYRDEERPNLLDESARTNVPYFVVHSLKSPSHAPSTLVVRDLEEKTEEIKSLTDFRFAWKHLHSFPTGSKVHILECSGRRSNRSDKTQSSMTCGGQFFFAKPFDTKTNPGDAFEFKVDGDEFFFEEDIWCYVKPKLKAALAASAFENWKDCCRRAKRQEFLGIILPLALDEFFDYHGDLSRETHGKAVEKSLSNVLWEFKSKVVATEDRFEQMVAKGESAQDAIHFKVYPENDFLRKYLSGGAFHNPPSWISEWAGKAKAVYPIHEEHETSD